MTFHVGLSCPLLSLLRQTKVLLSYPGRPFRSQPSPGMCCHTVPDQPLLELPLPVMPTRSCPCRPLQPIELLAGQVLVSESHTNTAVPIPSKPVLPEPGLVIPTQVSQFTSTRRCTQDQPRPGLILYMPHWPPFSGRHSQRPIDSPAKLMRLRTDWRVMIFGGWVTVILHSQFSYMGR